MTAPTHDAHAEHNSNTREDSKSGLNSDHQVTVGQHPHDADQRSDNNIYLLQGNIPVQHPDVVHQSKAGQRHVDVCPCESCLCISFLFYLYAYVETS